MKLITKNTDYAVRALIQLAKEPGRYVSAAEISKRETIPVPFLKRLLQTLIKEKYLLSREGAAGGVRLNKRTDRIRIIDIMKLFQGEFRISECMFRKRICPNRATCVLRRRMRTIESNLIAEFAGITIATLLKDKEES
jgi:Rrf2 family protein